MNKITLAAIFLELFCALFLAELVDTDHLASHHTKVNYTQV